MASLDDLTDGEIRVKLSELGYPVGPITSTTRKVLLKKLKHLLDQTKASGNERKDVKNRSSLTRYSSEDESDDAANGRNKRSMPPPPPKSAQKSVKRRSLSRRSDTSIEDESVNPEFQYPSASSTLYSAETTSVKNNKYSPKNIVTPNSNNSPDKHERIQHNIFGSFPTSLQSKSSPISKRNPFETGSDTDCSDEVEGGTHSSPSSTNSICSSFFPTLSAGLSQARSRFQPQAFSLNNDSPRYNSKSGVSLSAASNDKNSYSSQPFSSDFVRRLSAASSYKLGSTSGGLPSRLLDVKESDDEEVPSTPTHAHQNSGNLKRSTISSLDGNIWKNTTMISKILVVIFGVFFCIIAALYLNFRFKETPLTSTDTNFPFCKLGEKPGANCVLNSEVQQAMTIFREIYQVLNDRAVQQACGSGVESTALAEEQITQLVVGKSQMSVWDIEKHLGNIKVLIRANPQWGVEVVDNKYSISSPNLPIVCYIISLFYGIVGSALRLCVVAAVLFGGLKGVYWWFDRKERNKKEVFKMVESIIDILSTHQQSSARDNYLAISHVRDQLIPPQQRDKMEAIWEKAVAYLEANDSRVRTEVQQVLGEEFRVWRWLPAPRNNGKRKVWQGQAFETMEGSVNSLPVSPTPCLKIRHMFDSDVEVGEDWQIRVQDAILEKCEGVNVFHVAVDKNSNEGCVYVKCASPQDAGRAYRALHGSWFDSKLVTVKYLRLERYHERFPEAKHRNRPLRPSNDRKLSLQ